MYPLDRRTIANRLYFLLASLRKTAYLLQVSHSTISRWVRSPIRKPYHRPSLKADLVVEIIKTTILNNPFTTTRKLASMLATTLGISLSKELVRVVIKEHGLSWKKAKFFATPTNHEQKVREFIATRDRFKTEGKHFVSLDETGFGRFGRPVYGYAPKGVPLVRSKKPLTKAKPTSVVAVIDSNGLVCKEAIIGAYQSTTFSTFLKTLPLPKNTVILLDNASIHRSLIVKQVAEENEWILLYVPPYSPWFNPIEEAFSIVKRHYYQHWDVEAAFNALKPSHCQAFFKSAFKKLKGI